MHATPCICSKIKCGRVVFDLCVRTDRQINILITILRTAPEGVSWSITVISPRNNARYEVVPAVDAVRCGTVQTRRLTRRCFVESEYVAPSTKSLCEKTGKQIAGWVRMSRNHVFHGGPKYNILSLSGRRMSVQFNNPFLDWRYLGPFRISAPAKWKIDQNGSFWAPKFWTKFLKLHLYPTF